MNPKLDSQMPRHCLSKYFVIVVDQHCWQLINHQIYVPKLPQNRTLRNWKYMLRIPTFALKITLARRDIRLNIMLVLPFIGTGIGSVHNSVCQQDKERVLCEVRVTCERAC